MRPHFIQGHYAFMPAVFLTRRLALLLPLALAACGGDEQEVFEPLRYNYLPPIQLNVASIAIEQRLRWQMRRWAGCGSP